jgi:hypothetical protein
MPVFIITVQCVAHDTVHDSESLRRPGEMGLPITFHDLRSYSISIFKNNTVQMNPLSQLLCLAFKNTVPFTTVT